MVNVIQIPIRRTVEAREFYADRTDKALRDCLSQTEEAPQGCEPLYMPEIIDARIESPKDSRIWEIWWTAPSIRATGRTKQGKEYVVYAHVPNYFSHPENIEEEIKSNRNGAGIMSRDEFQRLLDLKDDKSVFVIDYETLKKSFSGLIKLKDALKHPPTIPFLGGKERAKRYLDRHEEVYEDRIGIWHSDDLAEEPLASLLFVGDNYYSGLGGNYYILYGNGHFLGVRKDTGEACAPKILPEQFKTLQEQFSQKRENYRAQLEELKAKIDRELNSTK